MPVATGPVGAAKAAPAGPVAVDPVPAAVDPVPAAADPVPAAVDPVPAAADPVPAAVDPVPAAADLGPVTTAMGPVTTAMAEMTMTDRETRMPGIIVMREAFVATADSLDGAFEAILVTNAVLTLLTLGKDVEVRQVTPKKRRSPNWRTLYVPKRKPKK